MIRLLHRSGALTILNVAGEWCAKLTKLGETMASFPISPRYAKMLALSCQYDLMQYVVCIVAALSVQEVMLQANGDQKWPAFHRNWAGRGNSLLLGTFSHTVKITCEYEICYERDFQVILWYC